MKRLPSRTVFERWAAKVGPQDSNGCWPWTGAARGENGRGAMGHSGKTHWAYRVGWELLVGPIPDGMCLCHKCDNPACVAPHHLFIGSHRDNMRDMALKGRTNPNPNYGADHHLSKLHAYARNVRMMAALGARQRDIAGWLGVTQAAVGLCVRGETHKESK